MERKQAKQTTCPPSLESTVQCSVRACATAPGCCVEVQRHPLSSLCTASASRGQASRGGWRAAASQSPATALAIDALSHQFESSVGGVTKRGRKREAMASKGKRHRHGENHAGTKKKLKPKQAHMHAHAHRQTHMHAHSHANKHTCTHIHTQTNTHTPHR